jgi:branched-chain amino acid transport system ATP-binding protein
MSTEAPLHLEQVSRRFGGLTAVDAVSLILSPGERHAIIGTNGAGKTTLFNLIAGQLAPSAGDIRLFGRAIGRLPPHRRAQLGLARTFQITSLFPRLTAMQNMLLAVQALTSRRFTFYRPVARCADLGMRAESLLERWNLGRYRHIEVSRLSYGVQRQLEIVLALAGEPRLLLLDEPMAGLSAAETHLASDIILALDRSVTVLLIEHDLAAAFRIADRVTAMDRGRIVASGTPAEMRQATSLQAIYLGVRP